MDEHMMEDISFTDNVIGSLRTRDDIEDYHINPKLDEKNDRIFVPCGFGNTDYGFFIYGINKIINFENRDYNVFSLVYNYLIRNSVMTDQDIPLFLKQQESGYEIEYRSVFRLAIVILQMVKNGYLKNGILSITYDEDIDNLYAAVEMINDYAARFAKLARCNTVQIIPNFVKNGQIISLRSEHGIYVKDNNEFISNAREMWYGRKINYNLTAEDLPDIEDFLHEISPFKHFREGQYEAICEMLRDPGNSVCIMPTGSGKSLVYYMLSIFQPLPIYIIAPTDILIQDQIRNLKEIHRIDDIAHLKLRSDREFSNFKAHNKLIYMTPMTLQNRNLLVAFRYINNGTEKIDYKETRIAPGALAAYIVLDEIHCLSNLGHDFRPEYLMLSRYLNTYLNNIKFKGFTATADYTVVKDIHLQLSIPEESFYSPVSFDKYNVSYQYIPCSNTDAMTQKLVSVAKLLMGRNERTIIFTKNDDISKRLARAIGYGAEVFSADNPKSYYSFAKGKSKILIASEDLGVGINFPNIRNIIHFGLPLSKNEYIQEIGRAGRANERVTSYVLYLSETPENVPANLLKRSTPMESIPAMLSAYDNDFADIYKKLTNNCPTKDEMVRRLIEFYMTFNYKEKAQETRRFSDVELDNAKQMLYMLFCTGFLTDWYSYGASQEKRETEIIMDVCSEKADEYRRDPKKILNRMKEKSTEFFDFSSKEDVLNVDDSKITTKVNWAESPEEILEVYVDWYYLKFLYHNNEEFLDLYTFITTSNSSDDDSITQNIKGYFELPFTKLRDDEIYFNSLETIEIIDKAVTGIGRDTMINLERIINDRYSYKIDLMLFYAHLLKDSMLEEDRFTRLLLNMPEEEAALVIDSFAQIYEPCDLNGRIQLLNFIEEYGDVIAIDYDAFFENAYEGRPKDLIYYAKAFTKFNELFRRKI